MMIGLQKDTYSNTTCPTSSVKLKNIIVTAEYIVYTVFQQKTVEITGTITKIVELLSAVTEIESNCFLSKFLNSLIESITKGGKPMNNVHNNIYQAMPKLMRYFFIFIQGLMMNSKRDMGEAVAIIFVAIFAVYRPINSSGSLV